MNTQTLTTTRRVIPLAAKVTDVFTPLADPMVRVATGLMLMPHGAQKLFGMFGGYGLEGTAGWLASVGYQPAYEMALAIGTLEFFGGLALALGFLTRPVAFAVVVFMAVAAFNFHWANGYFWPNGGFEYPLFWGIIALSYAIKGGGKLSLDRLLKIEF
ncbi:MAG: DoxX family membrane protein [Proteobacteria bacterium]|nr:DoxX family membrane protein [Pseudomonadota bacterium]